MKADEQIIDTVEGFDIRLERDSKKFEVVYTPGMDRYDDDFIHEYYDTYADAVAGIKKFAKQQAKIKSKVELRAVTADGRKVTIVGVHASRGHLLFPKQKNEDSRSNAAYPVVEWVEDAIREKLRLEKRKEELEAALQLVHIQTYEDGTSYHMRRQQTLAQKTEIMLRNYKRLREVAVKLATVEGAVKKAKELEKREERKRQRNRRW